ncbi:MAG: universal stress protein [Deltaproteobacteria bacterium]|nr:universal stress protein [Deltaproteobacteria bacterium]
MFQRILVIFENERICRQALSYSRELALRMDSEVAFLMVVEMAFLDRVYLGSKRNAIRSLEARTGKMIGDLTSEFMKEGITVSVALRTGDAAQELLKFLAERPPFQAVIWGSDEDLPDGGQPRRTHWIGKVADTLECPLLAVTGRARPYGPDADVKEKL